MEPEQYELLSMKHTDFMALPREYPSQSRVWGYVTYKEAVYFFQLSEEGDSPKWKVVTAGAKNKRPF